MSAPPDPSPRRRIVVDTDTGIDDALALLYLAGRPDAEIAAVTSVFGNCSVDDALLNIGLVMRLAGLPRLRIHLLSHRKTGNTCVQIEETSLICAVSRWFDGHPAVRRADRR